MAHHESEEKTLQTRIGLSEAVVRLQESLLLSWKTLNAHDVPLLTAVLPSALSLVELDLRHNKLADAGAIAVEAGASANILGR